MEANFKNTLEQLRKELDPRFRRGFQERREDQTRPQLDHHSSHGSIGGHGERTLSPEPELRRTPSRGRSPILPRGPPQRTPPHEEILESADDGINPRGYRQQQKMRDHKGSRDFEETSLKARWVEVSTFDGHLDPKSFLD